jgi:DNA-binding beta-propeller fold protein YncE
VDADGRVYVTDSGQAVVWVFDEQAKRVTYLGTSGQGTLKSPIGIAVDTRGVVFVSDVTLKRVYGFDRKGTLVVAIGKGDELPRPSGLAIDPATNRLYVSDTKLHKIRVYDASTGAFVKEIGERGTEEGKFNFPTNLFIRRGKLYVSDTGNFRVQILDLDGNFLKKIGQLGDRLGDLARPKGVAVDSDGHIYVADAAFDNFQIFNEEGKLLLYVGEAGTRPGRFWLPAGMYIDERDRIYVADQYNHRIQVFQYLKEARAVPVVDTRQ